MEKIRVSICTGTSCYVMGGSELLLLMDYLSAEQLEAVELEGAACFGCCSKGGNPSPPFVRVGTEMVSRATPHSVIEKIDQVLAANRAGNPPEVTGC